MSLEVQKVVYMGAAKPGTGGDGGDIHNLGSFATPAALQSAYPTANAGDFAIVESTDTIWVWDSDDLQWLDTTRRGQVLSVNGKTGVVVLKTSDLQNDSNYATVTFRTWGANE